MPLDAITLQAVVSELNDTLVGAKIDKIHQPEHQMVILSLRTQNGNQKLFISTGASPRLNLTDARIENPASPPMFCMLMRKHLTGARIRSISQPGLERIVTIELDTTDELGDPTRKTLTAELYGRQANLILYGADGRIIDCLRRVDPEMSVTRQVLPGLFYKLPEPPDRIDFRTFSKDELRAVLAPFGSQLPEEKRFTSLFMGLSPLIARELLYRAGIADDSQPEALAEELLRLSELIRNGGHRPVLLQKADGSPMDYTFMEILQYGVSVTQKRCASFSSMLDEFYLEKERVTRQKKYSQELYRLVTTAQERLTKKLALQKEEYRRALDREHLRKYGDLLMAGLNLIDKGATKARLPDYYVEGTPEIEIPLDVKLSPQQNAQRYYKNYNRMKNAEAALSLQLEQTERELQYLESVLDELTRAATPQELIEIREELLASGYLKDKSKAKAGKKKSPPKSIRPFEYKTSDGFLVLAGRNNIQNEELTLKTAFKSDLWFHTQKIPGSHVILICDGRKPTDLAKSDAAMIAAFHSKASSSARVPVDYTEVKNVKKMPGGKCGMVNYKNFETAIVTPDGKMIEKFKAGKDVSE